MKVKGESKKRIGNKREIIKFMLRVLKTCTGCHACMNICSKKCVSMKDNGEGFLYPHIGMDNALIAGGARVFVRLLMNPN